MSPLSAVGERLPAPSSRAENGEPPPRAWTLIYDGDCAFCRRCVALLKKWDRAARLTFVPFRDAGALAVLRPIPRAALEQAMHLVAPDGRVFAGAAAVPPILRLMPRGRWLARPLSISGVPWAAGKAYRQIARNRHRLGCGSATCTLGR